MEPSVMFTSNIKCEAFKFCWVTEGRKISISNRILQIFATEMPNVPNDTSPMKFWKLFHPKKI